MNFCLNCEDIMVVSRRTRTIGDKRTEEQMEYCGICAPLIKEKKRHESLALDAEYELFKIKELKHTSEDRRALYQKEEVDKKISGLISLMYGDEWETVRNTGPVYEPNILKIILSELFEDANVRFVMKLMEMEKLPNP
jgi:hypothetical protein